MGDKISTVESIQCNEGYRQYSGVSFSTVGDNISTVEVIEYSGDKGLKYYEFSKNLEIFPELISLRNQIDHITGIKC